MGSPDCDYYICVYLYITTTDNELYKLLYKKYPMFYDSYANYSGAKLDKISFYQDVIETCRQRRRIIYEADTEILDYTAEIAKYSELIFDNIPAIGSIEDIYKITKVYKFRENL